MDYDLYPDSYQNDLIMESLADFYNDCFYGARSPNDYDKISKHLLQLLSKYNLKIGFPTEDPNTDNRTNEVT